MNSGKNPKQDRSQKTHARLLQAVYQIVAQDGLGALTHRRLAQHSGVSLALTTYYFPRKADIIRAASMSLMKGYLADYGRVEKSVATSGKGPKTLWEFSIRMLRVSTGPKWQETLAWAEIYLDAARDPGRQDLVQDWMERLFVGWSEVADLVEPGLSDAQLQMRMDMTLGFLVMALALRLDRDQIDAGFAPGTVLLEVWALPNGSGSKDLHRQAHKTRDAVLAAAIDILLEDGPGAISYTNLANRAGVAGSTPRYHYPALSDLLTEAQQALFAASKDRYRAMSATVYRKAVTQTALIDLSFAVLAREVSDFRPNSAALFQLWLEAGRRPDLRASIWASIKDQADAWNRVFDRLYGPTHPNAGMYAQALFAGKLLRLLSSSGSENDLATTRAEFAVAFEELRQVLPAPTD
ncbi:hypothetical protein V8J82_19440 [Gymnodinialimonas sp. 2305UL16-5]|uniref:TetR/AcrR family transcriptional regulator n=1 Tax=Gymnodinialimonas mytili TaxID=3126503 RepID=UPI0030A077AA